MNEKDNSTNGKHLFGTVKVGEKGQIVIPKDARDMFGFAPGNTLVVLGDEASGGIALMDAAKFNEMLNQFMK